MIRFPSRPTVELDSEWLFRQGGRVSRRWRAGLEDGGVEVSLPHSWNEDDTYRMGRRSFSGKGYYRTRFILPEIEGPGTWHLITGGFYGLCDLWVDGRRLGRFDPQYLGLDLALPDLSAGEHLIVLRLDNRARRSVLPGHPTPDFLLYGGLACGVRLEHRPGRALDGARVTVRPGLDAAGAGVLRLRYDDPSTRPTVTLFEGTKPIVRRDLSPTADPVEIPIENIRPWSPDGPALYRLELSTGNDRMELEIGFRNAEFRQGTGFFLNGERLDLRGVNRHESIPGFGAALPPELQHRDAEIIRDLGGNFVRLSHYPQHPAFLDACDRLGLLVYPEIATWKSVRSGRRWLRAAERQMRGLILRDRHRPSIILWGMGNESRSRKAYLRLGAVAGALDPERPTIYAENHLYRARRKKTVGLPGVWGTNYELDVLEEAAASSGTGTVIVSECCNHPRSIKGDELEELTQLAVIERDWEAMAGRPYVAGYAVWCLTDYATEHRDRFRRRPGLLDAWRRPKRAASLYRARYATKPFVDIFVTGCGLEIPPTRFRRDLRLDEDGAHEIHVFSNCERIELRIDDGAAVELEGAPHHVVRVGARPGRVEATGFHDGITIDSAWRPSGPARAVVLRVDGEPAPGRTLIIDVDVVDAEGRLADGFNGRGRLSIDGPGRLRSYTPDDEVEIAGGEGRIFVTCDRGERGRIVLRAIAEELEPAEIGIAWDQG